MERIDPAALARYLADDVVATLSATASAGVRNAGLTSQRWLDDTPAKRLVFSRLYGDVFERAVGLGLLDVGGGLTALTPRLAAHSRYTLLDPLFHETEIATSTVLNAAPFTLVREDWSEWRGDDVFDVIVANDLFPNVDQRLALFLDWAIPRAREVRVSVTFYNTPRVYRTQRIGADEKLTVLAFDGARASAALAPFADRIRGWNPALFEGDTGSVFPNGRHVVLATLDGARR